MFVSSLEKEEQMHVRGGLEAIGDVVQLLFLRGNIHKLDDVEVQHIKCREFVGDVKVVVVP